MSTPDLYTIKSDALPPGAKVAGFVGREALSELYRFSIGVLTSGEEIDLAAARGIAVTLTIAAGEGDPYVVHGMIAEASLEHAWGGNALYRVVMVPKAWALTLTHFSRVFVDKTVVEIAEALLEESGLSSDDWEVRTQGTYKPHFHIGQYKESRWAFINRLLEREGLYYFFEQGDQREKLVITDHKSFHKPLRESAVRYVPLSGSDDAMSAEALALFRAVQRAVPNQILLRDFDYLKPNLDVKAEAAAWENSAANQVHLGEHDFRAGADGDPMASAAAEAFLAAAQTYQARGRVFGLRSGYRFKLEEHPLDSINGEYLVTELVHSGNQAAELPLVRELLGLDRKDDYHCELRAVLADVQYRPARKTPVPNISSVERGFVDGPADSQYAQLDEHGRYKVKLHFDIDDSEVWDGDASTWIRMLQPHGGEVEGFHFPLRKNTEVLIVFLGGNPDRPVIAGAVPNAVQPSPVTSEKAHMNMVVSGGSNTLSMSDLDNKQWAELFSPQKTSYLFIGNPEEPGYSAFIEFNTEGNQFINIGGDRKIEVGGAQDEHVVGDVTENYDAKHKTTVGGGRVEDVTGNVTETYLSNHKTDVTGTREEGVSGAVTENYYASWTQNVVGAADMTLASKFTFFCSGTETRTTSGAYTQSLGSAASVSVAANYSLDVGGQTSIKAGGPIIMQSPAITMITPEWKVLNPNDTQFHSAAKFITGDHEFLAGFGKFTIASAFEIKGVSSGVTGIKLEGSVYNGYKAAVANRSASADSRTSGVKAFLSGIFSVG